MKSEYSYDLVDGHIIVDADPNHLLIDTGAPSSVVNTSPLDFAGKRHVVSKNYMGVTPESLSGSIGTPIDALVGADILNQYDILIHPSRCHIVLSEEALPADGDNLSLDSFMGIPIIDAAVSGKTVRMFFDTGARLSYLRPELSTQFPAAGEESDFYPGMGEFTTQTYSVPIRIGTKETTLRVGTLPELLQETLMMANTDGILGTAVLDAYTILFAPRRKIMCLRERNG